MDINITLRDPDEARKAVALACELVSARVLAWRETGPDGAMPPVLREALGRAVAEILEGKLSPDALGERIAYPIAALALVGAVAVLSGGQALEGEERVAEGEGIQVMLEIIMEALAKREGRSTEL
jgi:hypothetical protein